MQEPIGSLLPTPTDDTMVITERCATRHCERDKGTSDLLRAGLMDTERDMA